MNSSGSKHNSEPDLAGSGSAFPTTHWTLLARVRQGGEVRRAALEELCGLYWYPIYAFVRRRGFGKHDAEDLTQGFFLKLLHDETFAAADVRKGRARTFLLQSLDRHLADQHRRQGAQKRGGGQRLVAFEEMGAEDRYACEPQDGRDPETIFMQSWAHLLVGNVREKLRESFAETGQDDVFETLLPFLLGEDATPSYREVAQKLEASETSVRVLVFRMRARFRDELQAEVARTVLEPQDLDDEMQWLKSALTAA